MPELPVFPQTEAEIIAAAEVRSLLAQIEAANDLLWDRVGGDDD